MVPELANIFGFTSPVEIAIIAGVVVLLFGGAKVAGFGKNLGEGMKEFKKAVREGQDEPVAAAPAAPSTTAVVAEKPADTVAATPAAPGAEKGE